MLFFPWSNEEKSLTLDKNNQFALFSWKSPSSAVSICPRPALAWVRHLTSRLTPPISLWLSGLGAHCLSDTRPQHKQWVCRVLSPWPRASRVSPRAQLPTEMRRSRSGHPSISSTGSFPLRQHLNEECHPMCRWILHFEGLIS